MSHLLHTKLKLTRPLIVFDLETTGLDIVKDRIIDLAMIRTSPDGYVLRGLYRFNPGFPIPPESTAIHGITDEDVASRPFFEERVGEIYNNFLSCDIVGFNSNNFDVPMLVEHFLRTIGKVPFDENTRFIDASVIFKKKEERTLSAALKFYCNREHTDAHSALGDVEATISVLQGQIDRYDDLQGNIESLSAYSQYDNQKRVDYAGKLVLNNEGIVCYNFGKAKGKAVLEDPGFGMWILKNDFPLDTKLKVEEILVHAEDDIPVFE